MQQISEAITSGLLQSFAEESKRQTKVLSAQVAVVEVFAAALGFKQNGGAMHPDILYALRDAIRIAEHDEAEPVKP